nr:MAG: hypothetical protein [Microvirus sp.]
MKNLLTGGLGFAISEIVQQSNVNDVAGAITQFLIAIITLIGMFNKKQTKQNETKNPD